MGRPYTLNLLDLCCTLYALNHGSRELNPLMQSVPLMAAYKVIIVGLLLRWLRSRPERIARLGLTLCTAVYAAVCIYHLIYITKG